MLERRNGSRAKARVIIIMEHQECQCARHAPQGVENVHTLCAVKPDSDDRGNNISVKRFKAHRCINVLSAI